MCLYQRGESFGDIPQPGVSVPVSSGVVRVEGMSDSIDTGTNSAPESEERISFASLSYCWSLILEPDVLLPFGALFTYFLRTSTGKWKDFRSLFQFLLYFNYCVTDSIPGSSLSVATGHLFPELPEKHYICYTDYSHLLKFSYPVLYS